MPPRKKAKNRRTEPRTTVAAHEPSVLPVDPSAEVDVRQATGRVKIQDLPVDVLIEIFGSFHPRDLVSFVRTCKDFRRFLLHPKHEFIWREARKHVATQGMPDRPPFLSEPAYAHLVFCWECRICATDNVRNVVWPWFTRYCSTCLPDMSCTSKAVIITLNAIDRTLTDDNGHYTLLNVANPGPEGSDSAKYNLIHRPQVEQLVHHWTEAKTADARDELLKKQRALVKERDDYAKVCEEWYSKQTMRGYYEMAGTQLERVWDTIDKLKAEGWGPEIEWLGEARAYHLDNRTDIWQVGKLTDKAFKKILAKFLPKLQEWRQDRLAGKTAPWAAFYRQPSQRYPF